MRRDYTVRIVSIEADFTKGVSSAYRHCLDGLDAIIRIPGWADAEALTTQILSADKAAGNVVSAVIWGTDEAATAGNLLRRAIGIPANDPESQSLMADKFLVRRKLYEGGLSKLRTWSPGEDAGAFWRSVRNGYVKPRGGSGSRYVHRCIGEEDVARAIENIPTVAGPIFVEEEAEGELLSIEVMIVEKRLVPLGLLSRILFSENPIIEMGSIFPYPHSREEEIKREAERTLDCLGVTWGIYHLEAIVTEEKVEFIDLNPRLVGADVIQSMKVRFGVNFVDQLSEYFVCGNSVSASNTELFSCLQYFLPPRNLVRFDALHIPDNCGVVFSNVRKRPGEYIQSFDRQFDYLGGILVTGRSPIEAFRNMERARQEVRIEGLMRPVW
jgi:biotin carboxylase